MPDFHDGNPDKQTTTETGLVWEPIKTAEGERPKADSVVEIAYAMWTHDGQLRDCTERRGSNVRSGVDRLNPFLQESILLIPLGARYRFEVPPSLFYPPGTPDAQRGNDKFIFEIEVVSIIEPMPIPEFSALAEDKTTTTESGLKYEVIEKSGSGVKPLPGQSCKVHYAGWLTTGDLFDSSYSKAETFSFPLARRGVIPGWDEGVALMEKGDTFKFLIPGELAYGARGRPPVIPPNASLVFYIQLIDIE